MIKFGTGGWRAIIGDDFSSSNIRLVAKGIADLIKESGEAHLPVVIGHDRRFLATSACEWIAEVLCHEGIKVFYFNRSVPTPLVMHMVKKKEYAFGIEVTASHNPAQYNGIKLIIKEGRDASVEVTERLEALISANEGREVEYTPFAQCVGSGLAVALADPFNDYKRDSLYEVAGCGFGAVMMTTQLLQEVRDRFRLPFFPAAGFGEDFAFCLRVRELGHRIWCDSSIKLGHEGSTIVDEELYIKTEEDRA